MSSWLEVLGDFGIENENRKGGSTGNPSFCGVEAFLRYF